MFLFVLGIAYSFALAKLIQCAVAIRRQVKHDRSQQRIKKLRDHAVPLHEVTPEWYEKFMEK